eukprot:CAMPEP_0116123906 /NCGR_PEP_ID=MMETSP0329-20121206/4999_1 /TAXON_ID=697910 /ORGANISM="Pseudo-nitzschia arenysensis, Strain B593" /LENGTH=430 /DNA_ID=CAMNT_0003617855 /DNA_START=73 /DNA_END=1365 /DNA_ORIENTATION=-
MFFFLALMQLLSVLTMLALPVCYGLCPTRLTSGRSSLSSLQMATSDIARARQRDREAKTLYDYLGASPKDSQEQLKIRYTTLAKKLHPDSNPDGNVESLYYDLSEINAAWEVLKDPVLRKKYDRELQSKEIADSVGKGLETSLEFFANNAIPFLQKTAVTTAAAMQKTASTTAAAMDASQKAAKEVNEQATKAYGAFETDQQTKVLEQKSNAESAKALKIQKEINALPRKKLASLEKKSLSPLQALQQPKQKQQQQPLSSSEAQRILKNFKATTSTMKAPPMSLSNDIKALTDTENKQKDATRVLQSTERAIQMAERKVEQATRAEEAAKKRLEEAQKALKDAQLNSAAAQEVDQKARTEERTAQQNSAKIETLLEKTRERVRVGLSQQQDAYMTCRTNELKKEKEECEKSSKQFFKQAKELKAKAKTNR